MAGRPFAVGGIGFERAHQRFVEPARETLAFLAGVLEQLLDLGALATVAPAAEPDPALEQLPLTGARPRDRFLDPRALRPFDVRNPVGWRVGLERLAELAPFALELLKPWDGR